MLNERVIHFTASNGFISLVNDTVSDKPFQPDIACHSIHVFFKRRFVSEMRKSSRRWQVTGSYYAKHTGSKFLHPFFVKKNLTKPCHDLHICNCLMSYIGAPHTLKFQLISQSLWRGNATPVKQPLGCSFMSKIYAYVVTGQRCHNTYQYTPCIMPWPMRSFINQSKYYVHYDGIDRDMR